MRCAESKTKRDRDMLKSKNSKNNSDSFKENKHLNKNKLNLLETLISRLRFRNKINHRLVKLLIQT